MKIAVLGSAVALAAAVATSSALGQASGQTSPATTKPPPATAKPAKPAVRHTPAPQPKQEAATTASGGSPILLGQYGEWGAYTATNGGSKVCFALAKPVSSPSGHKRGQVYVFIATRPAENVKNEVSIMFGYPFKAGTEATVEVGNSKFAMNTQNDGAWIKNVAEEARLVEIMRKGSDLTVSGTSSQGTQAVDHYSLKGLGQALERSDQECK